MHIYAPNDGLTLRGRFKAEAFESEWNPEKGLYLPKRKLWEAQTPNTILDAAINHIFNVEFNAATQLTTWYMGLIDNAGFSAIAAADTMSSHAGWTESQAYTEATRPSWGQGSASGKTITNATSVTFTINATVTIKGGFIASNSTKGGTSGTLWSAGAFSSGTQSLLSTQLLKLSYTLTGASS
jgi:hypothetical protein